MSMAFMSNDEARMLTMLTTKVKIGSLCFERHLFTDIKVGTIDVLQTEVPKAICRPLTKHNILDWWATMNTPNETKQSYSSLLMSASKTMFALQKASLNGEVDELPNIARALRACTSNLSRKIEDCPRTRTKFANLFLKHLENRAVLVIFQSLLGQSDDSAWAAGVWAQIRQLAQEDEVRNLLTECARAVKDQSQDLRQQLLETRHDAEN